jgi:hypothetical protein
MVRKIKIVEVYSKPEAGEEANDDPPPSDEAQVQQTNEITEPTVEPIEASESEHEPPPPPEPTSEEKPARKPKNKILDMPTTTKTLEQVECKACNRKMSAKTLKYNHAKYCTERVLEERPVDIPVPQVQLDNVTLKTKKKLLVKNLKLKKTENVVSKEVQQPTNQAQTPAMEETFQYKMAQKLSQKSVKYEAMMSNAF